MNPTVALISDFGLDDIYVGVMKGIITGIQPQARLIDITHNIAPQHVRQAAFALLNAYRYFPAGTVFLVVVDPGVGTLRQPIAVEAGGYVFIAPDNGVLSYALAQQEHRKAVTLTNPAYQRPEISRTFHGRDIFAPAAAYAASGVAVTQLGEPLDELTLLPPPTINIQGRRVTGEVLHVDHFGNIVSSIGLMHWRTDERLTLVPAFGDHEQTVPVMAESAVVRIGAETVSGISPTYGEVSRGELVALVGSSGYLELAVNQGNAAVRLDVAIGDRVELQIGDVNAAIRH